MLKSIFIIINIVIIINCIFITTGDTQENGCRASLDIFFLIDGSGSIGEINFNTEKSFVLQLANKLNPNNSNDMIFNRYGYIIFSSGIQEVLTLTNFNQLYQSLGDADFPGGGTNVLTSLLYVINNIFNISTIRPNTKRILVLLSDGDIGSVEATVKSIEENAGVRIIAFGFTGGVNEAALQSIVTEPIDENYFKFDNFDDALNSVERLGSIICPDMPPTCCQGTKGARGKRGQMGDIGEEGFKGEPGNCISLEDCITIGTAAIKGMRGLPGLKGKKGEEGEVGLAGAKGAIGAKGLTGEKGNKGVKGLQGPTGETGIKGEKGAPGAKGDTGNKGNQGLKGQSGNKGEQGGRGVTGVCKGEITCIGTKGVKGDVGGKGQRGIKGGDGANGAKGLAGDKGNKGRRGEKGDPGLNGDEGSKGTAIEFSTVTSEQSCTIAGELKYDNIQNKLHYCNGAQYICIGNNGIACECECTFNEEAVKCGSNGTFVVSGRNVSIDFVLVMDDSSSMKDQQAWILQHIPKLNISLVNSGIGNNANYPNTFQLVAFGGNKNRNGRNFEAPHFVTPTNINYDPVTGPYTDVTFHTNEELIAAINNLENFREDSDTGRVERGYETLNYTLANMKTRTSNDSIIILTLLIFVTNEDTEIMDYSEDRFDDLVTQFRNNKRIILTFIPLLKEIEDLDKPSSTNYAVAINPNSKMLEVIDNTGNINQRKYGRVKIDPGDNQNIEYVKRDYVDLLMCSEKESSSVWDLSFVDTNAEAFAVGFLNLSNRAIVRKRDLLRCKYCYCENAADNGCIDIQDATEFCDCLKTEANERTQDCTCIAGEIDTLTRSGTTILNEVHVMDINENCGIKFEGFGNCRNYTIS